MSSEEWLTPLHIRDVCFRSQGFTLRFLSNVVSVDVERCVGAYRLGDDCSSGASSHLNTGAAQI